MMVKTNPHIIGEQCIIKNDVALAGSHEDNKMAWKIYHKKLWNTEFEWNRNSFSQTGTVSGILRLIDRGMVRGSTSKMNNWKTEVASGVVSEMLKAAGETDIGMIINLVNHIIVEELIPVEWEISTIVNYYKWKDNSLGKINYRGLKLTDQILNIAERIIK